MRATAMPGSASSITTPPRENASRPRVAASHATTGMDTSATSDEAATAIAAARLNTRLAPSTSPDATRGAIKAMMLLSKPSIPALLRSSVVAKARPKRPSAASPRSRAIRKMKTPRKFDARRTSALAAAPRARWCPSSTADRAGGTASGISAASGGTLTTVSCLSGPLLRPPPIEGRGAPHAADRAPGLAPFRRMELPFQIVACVVEQVDARLAASLAAVVHLAEFVDVKIPAAGPALERRRSVLQHVLLPSFAGAVKDGLLARSSQFLVRRGKVVPQEARQDLALVVVHQADRHVEPQGANRGDDLSCLLQVRGSEHRVDVHAKGRVLFQQVELLTNLRPRFLRELVRLHVVDRHLQQRQLRGIEPADPLPCQWITVRDHRADDALRRSTRNEPIQVRMQKGFAAGQREDERAEPRHVIDPTLEQRHIDGRRDLVVLGAIAARQVASAGDHQLHEERPAWGREHQRATLQTAERMGREKHLGPIGMIPQRM